MSSLHKTRLADVRKWMHRSSLYSALLQHEQHPTLVNLEALASATTQVPLNFVVYSCLPASRPDREELTWRLEDTRFFRRFLSETRTFLDAVGQSYHLTIILHDTEPVRRWGWDVCQDEVTAQCALLAETSRYPDNWQIVLWSAVEFAIADRLPLIRRWADQASLSPRLARLVYEQLERIRQQPYLVRKAKVPLPELVRRKIREYACEGAVLEAHPAFQDAILLRTEAPASSLDQMMNLIRTAPLAILHPWIVEGP